MNKYIVPICDNEYCFIIDTNARSLAEAESKLLDNVNDMYGLEYDDWDTLINSEWQKGTLTIGEIKDIEEF